jgi:hypothetical protein
MRLTHLLCLAAVLASAVLPKPLAATITYLVTANTSAISGQSGYLDLQFEPGPSATNLATATVTHFSGTGALSGSATRTGDVTGQLPSTLSFDNQTVFNDYFQGINFGTTESFDVTLNGPSPSGGSVSTFYIAFYASDQSTSLLSVSPEGEAGQITINPDGSTSPSTYAATVNGASALTITPLQPLNTVPEPSGFALLALGAAFAILRKHRN